MSLLCIKKSTLIMVTKLKVKKRKNKKQKGKASDKKLANVIKKKLVII